MKRTEITAIDQSIIFTGDIVPRLLSINQFMYYSGLGRNRAMEYAVENGWVVRFGKRVFIDKIAFDNFIDSAVCLK